MSNQRCIPVLAFIACAAMVNAKFFKFEDCSKEDSIAKVSNFSIAPDPVIMKANNMTVDMMVSILQDVPPEAVLRTRYYKLRSVFGVNIDIPIPCLLGKFGSCTLRLCEYLKMFKDQASPFFPSDVQYGCPVKAGEYGGGGVDVEIPDMGVVARTIISGKYRTELTLFDRLGGKQLACYIIHAQLR